MEVVVEFANRPQLLKAITTLPQELGPVVNFAQGELRFTRGRSAIPRSYAVYGYNEHSGWFETQAITIPRPSTEEEATNNMSELLLRGIVPGAIMVSSLSGGKHFIELFKEKLLPALLKGRYEIESAEFGVIGPKPINGERWGPRKWGIGVMDLVTNDTPVHDLDTRSPILPTWYYMRVREGAISGWFDRLAMAVR